MKGDDRKLNVVFQRYETFQHVMSRLGLGKIIALTFFATQL
jgi:hypothetical protein